MKIHMQQYQQSVRELCYEKKEGYYTFSLPK